MIVLWAISPTERRRRSVMQELELGDSLPRVVQLLGEPKVRCPGAPLRHLQPMFPPGWPSASVEAALTTLGEQTSQRLVYPVNPTRPGSCAPREGQTELGLDARQRLLWYVTVTGKTPLRIPPDITPATPDGTPELR